MILELTFNRFVDCDTVQEAEELGKAIAEMAGLNLMEVNDSPDEEIT